YLRGEYLLSRPQPTSAEVHFRFVLRGYYDGVFDLTDRYPPNVEADEESEVSLREAVLAVRMGQWDLRIGRQQVVWGEAVGLFFADVVNPKDWREFLLRDFDDIRIPLWGVNALYDAGRDRVLEIFWSPEVRFSRRPVAGAEFAFFVPPPPAGVNVVFVPVAKPPRRLSNSNLGVRYSWLQNGWDAAVFYHRALDDLPAISKNQRSAGSQPASRQDGGASVNVSLLHPRVHRLGVTVSKPLGSGVWRSEAVFTWGKLFEAATPTPALKRSMLTAMIGARYPVSSYTFDLQLFQTAILGDAQPLREPKTRTGFSLRFADDASLRRVKPVVLLVMSLNERDLWLSPKVDVRLSDDTTLTLGVDWFHGHRDTLFGQFHDARRAQVKVTRRF
ncbi:MAG: hypothetical protein NZT92_06485, partial [Abditibacteriales bacterium]|nr:hypothetical protein [Abditibacteriales bacterium]MDW8365676.1 DUF1302 family protein [Abditibacteriales bacterium]